MVCKCKLDKPEYPQNDEWGPNLWIILHTLAERSGKQTHVSPLGDEKRAWPLFFAAIGTILPCSFCKEHFDDWVSKHPFLLPPDYKDWNTFIRRWFYELHENVNKGLGKPSFPFENLSSTYSNGSIVRSNILALEKAVVRAIKMDGVKLFAWNAWLKQYRMLCGIFGL